MPSDSNTTGPRHDSTHRGANVAGRSFAREFVKHPGEVASVVPSSTFLETRLVAVTELQRARCVVELGPGTGGTTRALLAALSRDGRLLAIEINGEFVERLRRIPDDRLLVHHGSADEFAEAIAAHDLPAPDAVISGIPFSILPRSRGRRLLRAIWWGLAPGGRFVGYQIGGRLGKVGTEIMGRPESWLELRNIPPLRVYRWRKPAQPSDRSQR